MESRRARVTFTHSTMTLHVDSIINPGFIAIAMCLLTLCISDCDFARHVMVLCYEMIKPTVGT